MRLNLNTCRTFVSNKSTVWPVTALELRENQHAFVADLKGVDSGNLCIVWASFIVILNEIIVQIVMEIILWNLVLHNDCVGNSVNNGGRLLFEEFNIFVFVEASIPSMSLAVFGALDNEYDLVRLHILYEQRGGIQKRLGKISI